MALPVALQLFSVREQMVEDFEGTLRKVKEMGYDGVELAWLGDRTAVEAKEIIESIGLKMMSAHVALDDLEKDEVLDDYKAAGLKYIVIPFMMPEFTVEWREDKIRRITEIGKRCKERGMVLLYHNHEFEFKEIEGIRLIDSIYDGIPAELLQSELDTCWVNIGGEKPDDFVRKFTGRAPVVHLKDFVGTHKGEGMDMGDIVLRPVGYGRQDMPAIIQASIDAGAEWLVVEQDEPSMDKTALECAKMSIEYLHQLEIMQE